MTAPAGGWKYLEPNPRSNYRQLWIKGRRIRADVIFTWSKEGGGIMTPEEVADDYGLPLEAVCEAIAYCRSEPPELIDDRRREDMLVEASGANEPGARGRVVRRLSPEEHRRIMNS